MVNGDSSDHQIATLTKTKSKQLQVIYIKDIPDLAPGAYVGSCVWGSRDIPQYLYTSDKMVPWPSDKRNSCKLNLKLAISSKYI